MQTKSKSKLKRVLWQGFICMIWLVAGCTSSNPNDGDKTRININQYCYYAYSTEKADGQYIIDTGKDRGRWIIKPVPIKMPGLLSISRDKWPQHIIEATDRGIHWGQCRICNFPVTNEDVGCGWGRIIEIEKDGHKWPEYYCDKHKDSSN